MRGLENKVAVVTGGASGMGAEGCRRFIEEGARVAIADINLDNAERLASELGEHAFPVQFDAIDVTSVKQMIDKVASHFGGIDCLWANHACMGNEWVRRDTDVVNTDFEVLDQMMAVNARGFMACAKYAIPHMLERGGGSIVFTSAGSAERGDFGNFAYAASKAAINNMARYVATAFGKQDIRCNAVSPGLIMTEGAKANVNEAAQKVLLDNMLTTRLGVPNDVAAMAVFLCSEDAGYITGQVICVDGGVLIHAPHFSDAINGRFGSWGDE